MYNYFFILSLSPENIVILEEFEKELRDLMMTTPLSDALTKVVEYLVSAEALVEPQISEGEGFSE